MHSDVGIDPQTLPYGFLNEIMDHPCSNGGPRNNKIACTKLMKDVPNFVKDVPSVPKCIPRWGSTPNHFLIGSKMKSWTIHVQMGDPEAIGSDVPNLRKDVPRVPN